RPTALSVRAAHPKHQGVSRGLSSRDFGCCGLGRRLYHDLIAVPQRAIKLLLSLDPACIQPLPLHGLPHGIEWRQASLRSCVDEDEMDSEARGDGPLPTARFHSGQLTCETFAESARDVALRYLTKLLAEQEGIA